MGIKVFYSLKGSRKVSAQEMIHQLGFMKLPAEGMKPKILQGVWVWVKPAGTRKNFSIRVMCACPGCGKELAASRLPQHLYTTACNKRFEATQSWIDDRLVGGPLGSEPDHDHP